LSSLQIHRSFTNEDALFVTRFALSFVLDIAHKERACSSPVNETLHYVCCLQSNVLFDTDALVCLAFIACFCSL